MQPRLLAYDGAVVSETSAVSENTRSEACLSLSLDATLAQGVRAMQCYVQVQESNLSHCAVCKCQGPHFPQVTSCYVATHPTRIRSCHWLSIIAA